MGFKRPALTATFEVYSSQDSSVQIDDIEAYRNTLDKSLAKIGKDASKFILRPITTSQKMSAYPDGDRNSIQAAYSTCEYIVRCCLVGVENFEVGGEPLKMEMEDGILKRDVIDKMQDENLVFELASYARQISHLPPMPPASPAGETSGSKP